MKIFNTRNYTKNFVLIKKKKISLNSKVFIIAELSGNHGMKLKNVFKAIDGAKEAGADAIKIQSYEPDTITINTKNKYFYINDQSLWKGRYLYDLYKSTFTPFSWHKKIFSYARKKGILCFSSPFDITAVDLLEKCNCPAYKIASPEIEDLELIDYISKKKKPIIISTGIATEKDIFLAIKTCLKNKNNNIILLNCISSYPAKNFELNLLYINLLKRYSKLVGYSDHCNDIQASLASVALGAKVIEKHFILNYKIKSHDKTFSIDKKDFKLFVNKIRDLELMMGSEIINKKKILKKKLKTITRSLFYLKDIKKNQKISRQDIKSVRPGLGVSPQILRKIVGKKIKFNVKKYTPIKKNQF